MGWLETLSCIDISEDYAGDVKAIPIWLAEEDENNEYGCIS